LALPPAYYLSVKWLDNFAYRAEIGPWVFIETVLITVLICSLSVAVRTVRAALANPVESLRYE